MGCDFGFIDIITIGLVSIHAPVWGATLYRCDIALNNCFNPRTRVGCDTRYSRTTKLSSCFNPRTRVGCDGFYRLVTDYVSVSIHAPVWGATRIYYLLRPVPCFNPRTRVGCDTISRLLIVLLDCFNPRTRVGCDWIICKSWAA